MKKMLQSQFSDDLQTQPGYDLDSESLLVSPAMFAPSRLCSCNPGWSLGCLGGGFAVQDISLDANTVELQGNYGTHTCQDCKNSLKFCFHSDLSKIPICLLHLHTLRKGGTGATCEKCPADSFSDEYSSKECKPCPPGSKAVAGATSVHSCACDVGVLYKTTGSWKLFRTAFSSHVLTVFMKQLIWKGC